MTVSPATAPPTIAPTFVDLDSDGAAVGFGFEAMEDPAGVLRLVTRDGIIWISDEVDLDGELLDVALDFDVVDACTVFGTASKVSIFASFPQAMYSNDWFGPLNNNTVEQNWLCSLESFSYTIQDRLVWLRG